MRTSIGVFINPREGKFPEDLPDEWKGKEGIVYRFASENQKLVDGETTTSFFKSRTIKFMADECICQKNPRWNIIDNVLFQ